MSNFLQRIATTVIQPKARLQPMFGSIFAPATLPSPAEPFSAQSEISPQTFASQHQQPITALHVDLQARASQAFASEDRLFPATTQPDSSAARNPGADQPFLPVFRSRNDVRETAHQHPFVEDSVLEFSKPGSAHQSASPGPYQPLIAASQQPPPRLQPCDSLPTSTAGRTPASESGRRSQPAQREADEIHIHIGRIEVAAITQLGPRPAAAAARRSLNLDDYLKRGNGRPG